MHAKQAQKHVKDTKEESIIQNTDLTDRIGTDRACEREGGEEERGRQEQELNLPTHNPTT